MDFQTTPCFCIDSNKSDDLRNLCQTSGLEDSDSRTLQSYNSLERPVVLLWPAFTTGITEVVFSQAEIAYFTERSTRIVSFYRSSSGGRENLIQH